jgi:two-component system cell cycle response regulator DivK
MATVLVADDFLENRDILCRMLQLIGYQTVSAANGEEAIQMALAHRPDIILMDLSMPVMDGWEATSRIKALDELRHVPVLAVTGHVTPHEIQRAIARRMRRLCGKADRFRDAGRKGVRTPAGWS